MSSIVGYWNLKNVPIKKSSIDSMNSKLNHWNADKIGKWQCKELAFGHLMLYNTPESLTESLPLFDSQTKLCITADARIDNRKILLEKLALTNDLAKEQPDSWFILKAYEKWGKKCTKYLEGDFAFAIFDQDKQTLLCVRDQIGIKPLYYYYKDGLFVFSSEIKGILALEEVDQTLSEKWIAEYTVNIKEEARSTIYKHIFKLEAAHQLTINQELLNIERYFDFDTKIQTHLATEQEYIDTFLVKLNEAIKKRLRSSYRISTELSGGLDSSVVTSIAHKILKQIEKPIIPISDVLPLNHNSSEQHLVDDRGRINELNQLLGIKNNEFVTGEEKSIISTYERTVHLHDEPPKKYINVSADLIYEKAQELNSRVLLSGFGGDDVVSYQGHFYEEELFLNKKWKTLWNTIKFQKPDFLGQLKRILKIINSVYNEKKSNEYHPPLTQTGHIERKALFNKKIEKQQPTAEMDKKYNLKKRKIDKAGYSGKNVNEKIVDRLKRPLIYPHRLPNCNLSAAHNKVEIRYPLLDVPLIQYYLSIPSEVKCKNGINRYLFKAAAKGIIPESIRLKPTKRFSSSPSHLWRLHRDKALFLETLKALPDNQLVNKFIKKNEYIKIAEHTAYHPEKINYGGRRLYFLQRFFEKTEAPKIE
jgi:asparagine synthase (glutamine-hydrolysing)